MDENKMNTPASAEPSQTPAPKKRPRVSRKLRYGTASTVLTVVVIAGIVLLNVVAGILGDRYPISLDLTADDTYTITTESTAVAKAVTDEVQVIAFQDESYYASPSFGNEIDTVARQFYEAMKQYNVASGGKVTTRFINYANNPTLVTQYEKYKVTESAILFLCGERYSVVSLQDMFTYDEQSYAYYGTLTITDSTVEQVIATNIRKVSGDLAPVVVMTGHSEDSYALANVKTVLGNNAYTTVECDLTKTPSIDVDAITMVIPAPATDYSAEEIIKIRDWLQQGGEYSRNLVLLANYTADCPNLYELINEEYGIEVTREMVYETSNYHPVLKNTGAYGTIGTSDFTAELADKNVLSIGTLRLMLHKDNNTDLALYNVPLVTFGTTAKLVDLTDTTSDTVNPYAAAAYPVVGAAYAHKQVPSPTTNTTVDSYVMVYGSSSFLRSDILSYVSNAENEKLFVGLFNGVSGSSEMTTISSRSMTNTTLSYGDSVAKWVGIGVFTVAIPVCTLAIGLIVFLRRRHL